MPYLRLESPTDAFDLDEVFDNDYGFNALVGVTGLGLPPALLQYIEGAGDGAYFRGERIQPRDIDIPIYLRSPDRFTLKNQHARLNKMFTSPMVLKFVEDDGSWYQLDVRRAGGGTYIYGQDTVGERELRTVVTLRAGDPFWRAGEPTRRAIGTSNSGRGLLKGVTSLSKLRVSGTSATGNILFENPGDAVSYPIWTITGPASPDSPNPTFRATSQTGETFAWNGTLLGGDILVIDSKTGSVRKNGVNAYGNMLTAPRFWGLASGNTQVNIVLSGTSSASRVLAEWYPRKWAMI